MAFIELEGAIDASKAGRLLVRGRGRNEDCSTRLAYHYWVRLVAYSDHSPVLRHTMTPIASLRSLPGSRLSLCSKTGSPGPFPAPFASLPVEADLTSNDT